MNARRIVDRINGRNMAAEVASLLDDADFANRDYMESFVEEIKRVSGHWVEAPEPVKHEPIARLGSTVMPFGEYQHRRFDDVPLNYLDWLCRTQEDFYRGLRAYLKHPDLESRRSAEVHSISDAAPAAGGE